jgi:glyceraldehyde 3-phosphate dehydrogenase
MIGINGLGRIGRLLVRRLASGCPEGLSAINDPADLDTLVHLLRRDTVHGLSSLQVSGRQEGGRDFLLFKDRSIPLFHEADPANIPFDPAGVRLVVESSGRFTRRAEAARHVQGNVSHVVISAPSPDADFTIIAPINGKELQLDRHRIISNASCTAHATAPMLQVLEEAFGIEAAGMSTVHVATNDQRLVDAPHKDLRRARAAFRSIIPTTSSAFEALHRVQPWLPHNPVGSAPWGFSGFALRVPLVNVNLVDLTATLRRDGDATSVKRAFQDAAAAPRWHGLLGLAHKGAVSCDFTGRPESILVDLDLTRSLGQRFVKIFGWHDNETGYAARLEELVVAVAARLR